MCHKLALCRALASSYLVPCSYKTQRSRQWVNTNRPDVETITILWSLTHPKFSLDFRIVAHNARSCLTTCVGWRQWNRTCACACACNSVISGREYVASDEHMCAHSLKGSSLIYFLISRVLCFLTPCDMLLQHIMSTAVAKLLQSYECIMFFFLARMRWPSLSIAELIQVAEVFPPVRHFDRFPSQAVSVMRQLKRERPHASALQILNTMLDAYK